MAKLDPVKIRKDFPSLQLRLRGRPPTYLDSACTTLRPEPVIQAVASFQRATVGCHGRTNHAFGRATTQTYDNARAAVQRFLGAAEPAEIVFVRNTTEAINLAAASLPLQAGDEVITTDIEHNSNLLPWQRLARQKGVVHRVHSHDIEAPFDMVAFRRLLGPKTRVVALPHTSNLCGITLPIARIAEAAHDAGALVLVDGAQAVTTQAVDVQALGADFYALSFHKMFGPGGIGALYGRRDLLERFHPFLVGGGTVDEASFTEVHFEPVPDRLEAGVCNYEGAVGAHAAIEYLEAIGQQALHDHVVELNRVATDALLRNRRLRLLGPRDPELRGPVFAFTVDGLESEALARLLDTRSGIMVRYGKLCVNAWFAEQRMPGAVRASFSAYNTREEVQRFARTVAGSMAMIG